MLWWCLFFNFLQFVILENFVLSLSGVKKIEHSKFHWVCEGIKKFELDCIYVGRDSLTMGVQGFHFVVQDACSALTRYASVEVKTAALLVDK